MKTISILGSTGSIGTQTLDVVRRNAFLKVAALAANTNVDMLEEEIREFRPFLAAVFSEEAAAELRDRVRDLDVRVVAGMDGLIEAAVLPAADIVVGSVVGMIGIAPTIEAVKAGKDIAIANKETLVTAGHIIVPLANEKNVRLIPVDSEHSAIFQCLHGEEENEVSRILLTASGGPFYGKTREELRDVTAEQALRHPNWSMGKKVTIDSSTLVNKGLEVMEAHWLFSVPYDRIEVVIQPRSIVHSMVEFCDGCIKAQLGTPDMRSAIQYALDEPRRHDLPGDRIDFSRLTEIRFGRPDLETFPGLKLAYEAGKKGGNTPTVFNAANEFAVREFLSGHIPFLRIPELIEEAMERVPFRPDPSFDEILETENATYEALTCLR